MRWRAHVILAVALASWGGDGTRAPAPTPIPVAPADPVRAPPVADRVPAEAPLALEAPPGPRHIGPFHVPFLGERAAFVVAPASRARPSRLLAMLHGVCVGPEYTCGGWTGTASRTGFLVCPTGNKPCDPSGQGEATWEEPFSDMDADLERAVSAVSATFPGELDRRGAILAGFSRGAYVAVILAVRHPGRWPLLILNEADVELTVPMMRQAGVRAVALLAGEWGAQIDGERRTAEALRREGFPIRLWVMPRVAHAYSADIDALMGEAVDFVLAHEHDG